MDDDLIQELVNELFSALCEIRALKDLLVDRKIVTEEELTARIRQSRFEFTAELKTDAARRRLVKLLADQPIQ